MPVAPNNTFSEAIIVKGVIYNLTWYPNPGGSDYIVEYGNKWIGGHLHCATNDLASVRKAAIAHIKSTSPTNHTNEE